jgi:hypothetical protein
MVEILADGFAEPVSHAVNQTHMKDAVMLGPALIVLVPDRILHAL